MSKRNGRKMSKAKQRELYLKKEWYNCRASLGCTDWAWFYIYSGGREAGKSYTVMEFFVRQWKLHGIPFTWLRLNEASMKKMLANGASRMVDADLVRKYGLDISVKGNDVYDHGKRMATLLALSTFANDKGVAMFDKDFLKQACHDGHPMYYHIALDEFQKELDQRSTGDIAYQFVNQMENLVRSTKERMRIFLICNTLEEASDIMAMFNFAPQEFGRYKIKKKHCYIDYMEPTEAYKTRREGTIGDILAGDTSNYTNEINFDKTLVTKQRLFKPTSIIYFTKDVKFTVWDGKVVAPYRKEKVKSKISMRPYLDLMFDQTLSDAIVELFDKRGLLFKDLTTYIQFQKQVKLLKPRD